MTQVLWRGTLNNWQRGQAGHINIQHYAQIAEDASHVFARLSGTPLRIRSRSEQLRFLSELHPGDAVYVDGSVARSAQDDATVDDGFITLQGVIRRAIDDRPVCRFSRRIRPWDVEAGAFTEWPGRAHELAATMFADPLDVPTIDPHIVDGTIETYRGTVEPREIDHHRLMTASGIWDKLTRALWAAQTAVGLGRENRGRLRLGGGAVVFDLDHLEPVSDGDPIVIHTGVLGIGSSSLRMQSEIRHATAGTPMVRARYVLAFVDLSTRSSAPVPDEVRLRVADLGMPPAV